MEQQLVGAVLELSYPGAELALAGSLRDCSGPRVTAENMVEECGMLCNIHLLL